jgi:type IV pilus assembly protein PilO
MTLDELNNLDPNNIGSWPLLIRIVIILVVCVVILGAGLYYDVKPQREVLATEEKKEVELKSTFEIKQRKAANLEALKLQMQEMQQSFGDLLRQLPNKTEVAGLIVDISQTGLAAGLEFELFKPAKEIPSDFYAELPIQISVLGNYHQFGEFISGVAALPRIVTTHNINIDLRTQANVVEGQGQVLIMKATAKTYRALDTEEEEEG